MADIAVFASGRGSNFIAIHKALEESPHNICAVVCDRKAAGAIVYATEQGIPVIYEPYFKREAMDVEKAIVSRLAAYQPDLLVLAGYMRLLTPFLVKTYENRILNIHPSLLPLYPGTDSIRRSWEGGDDYLGITIHYVDEGMDTGQIIVQQKFHRSEAGNLEEAEQRIHELEHFWYPQVVTQLLENPQY